MASVWLFHGLFNKLLHGSPRHLAIVQSVPGLAGENGRLTLLAVALFEITVAIWVLWGRAPYLCASVQTTVLLSMNVVELTFARPLLLWPAGLIPVNLLFLSLAWVAATRDTAVPLRVRLRRHPFPIAARLRSCLTLTYAFPAAVLEPLVSPGLALDTVDGYGFVAVALVNAEALRPDGFPRSVGRNFFLAGYRVFTTFQPAGELRPRRGLQILRSDTDRRAMVTGGNLFTHYNYHRCDASVVADGDRLEIAVRTPGGRCDLDVTSGPADAVPHGSPFQSLREARRFAGPLLFTFDYERETHSIIAIEGRRTHWRPAPVTLDSGRVGFFDDPMFNGCTPILAAAFHVSEIDYHWGRGVRYPLDPRAKVRP